MAVDLTRVKRQVIQTLNAGTRNSSGVGTYNVTVADKGYLSEEIDTAIREACISVMQAICETDGHPARTSFLSLESVTHASVIPEHHGEIGVPVITPYSGASATLLGTRKSYEDVQAYRANPNNIYDTIAHNLQGSSLAGYYATVGNYIYFTGHSAQVPLANFEADDDDLIPDAFEPAVIKLSLGYMAKDGAASDIFSYYLDLGQQDLGIIRSGGQQVPNIKPTGGVQDRGTR